MASVHTEKRNSKTYRRLQFYDRHGGRRSVRLGAVNAKSAKAIRAKVEHLVSASISGSPLDSETSLWVSKLGKDLADKLVRVGLIVHRETATLSAFIDTYITSRTE